MKMIFLTCALGLAVPVEARDSAATPPEAKPPAPKEKRLCQQESVIGSNIPVHICLTKAEWAELAKHYESVDQSFIERRKDQFNAISQAPKSY